MAVVVKDLNMPKCCNECQMCYEYVRDHCWKNGDWFSRSGFDPEKSRLPECQLMAAKVVNA